MEDDQSIVDAPDVTLYPSQYMYVLVPNTNNEWVVYDNEEIMFYCFGKHWYRRQNPQSNRFDAIAEPMLGSTLLVPNDLLCSIADWSTVANVKIFNYMELVLNSAGETPRCFTFFNPNQSSTPELHKYNIDWIAFRGNEPDFVLKGDLTRGYDWYCRCRPGTAFKYVNAYTEKKDIEMDALHLAQVSNRPTISYDTFLSIEQDKATRKAREAENLIAKLKKDQLELARVLAQVYASLPKAPE